MRLTERLHLIHPFGVNVYPPEDSNPNVCARGFALNHDRLRTVSSSEWSQSIANSIVEESP